MHAALSNGFAVDEMHLEGCGVFEGNRCGSRVTRAFEEQPLIGADREYRHVSASAELKKPR